jgi:magnesium-transporting ATPase (P-type)
VKTIEERKREVEDWCKFQYREKPLKKGGYRTIEYKTTLETAIHFDKYEQTTESFSIKLNFHLLLFTIVILCLFSMYGCWIMSKADNIYPTITFAIIMIAILSVFIFKIFDRTPKIILNKDGFWVDGMKDITTWQYLAASFILKNHDGEDAKYYLVLDYYKKEIDSFTKIEYEFDELEMDIEDICFHIEKFKSKANLLHN